MEQTKTHWKKLQHPDYIGAYELMDGTTDKELTVTIQKVARQMVTGADGKKEECTVAALAGHKPMILNSTNQKTMTKIFGTPYIEDWAGKKMTLYVAKVKAFGETVDALRIRTVIPKLPELNPQHPKWADAIKAMKSGATDMDAIERSYIVSTENKKLLLA